MTDMEDAAVETLQPEDFAVFGGYDFKDGQQLTLWLSGPSVITSFGMEIDNVDITVRKSGALDIKPKVKTSCIGGFAAGPDFWARTSELQLVDPNDSSSEHLGTIMEDMHDEQLDSDSIAGANNIS